MTRKQKKILFRIIASALLLVVLHFLPLPDNRWIQLGAYLIPYLLVGYDVIWGGIRKIGKGNFLDEEFLMMIATIGALVIGEYPEASAVMLFYQLGELFQSIAVGKSRKSISDLMDICPESAVVLRDGSEEEVDPEEVEIGEIVLVRPGEKVPIDGEIVEGTSSLNTAALTGESAPVEAAPGTRVFSGSINLTSAIKVKTTAAYEDSTVSKILELVENSTDKKSRSEKFITRFAHWYTPTVVILAILIAVICMIFTNLGFAGSLYRGLVFLVVSCPCALVVSVPLSFFGGIGAASRRGILIKGSNYLEALSEIDTLVLDKTGTITRGVFAVEAIHAGARCGDPAPSVTEDMLLDIAALAESHSRHPVAESIVEAHGGHIDPSRLGEVEEIAGHGIRAVIDGQTFYVGNGKLMTQIGAAYEDCHLPGTIVHLARVSDPSGNALSPEVPASDPMNSAVEYLGHIVINDELKEDSARALAALSKTGVNRIVMLTGDNEKVASRVAEKVGITEYRAGLLPAGKVTEVEALLGNNSHVAFAGDGINDAPVLTRADVGIAMGALGSDAAIEAADIVLMDDHLSRIPEAMAISRKTMRLVKENITFSIAVKVIIMILGAFGLANMRLAIFGDVGVLILAILNALRAMRVPKVDV